MPQNLEISKVHSWPFWGELRAFVSFRYIVSGTITIGQPWANWGIFIGCYIYTYKRDADHYANVCVDCLKIIAEIFGKRIHGSVILQCANAVRVTTQTDEMAVL